MSSTSPIHIGSAPGGAPLGPQQKKFNTHVQRIAAQRELLAAWHDAVDAYRARHAAEFEPLLADYRALTREMALLLDAESDRKGLSKADRATLGEAVASLAGDLADSAGDDAEREAMKALYNRHADGDFDAEEAKGREMAREMAREVAQDLFGIDLEGVDLDSPEAVARHVEEKMQAAQAQAEAARAAHQAQRRARKKPSARERKEQEAAQQASQSLRDIYRKLASSLHPDREPDPAERERKTALMQRANQAYTAHNLLDLLQLQLEAEHIDPARIASLGEDRLKHYNRVLAEQLLELQREVLTAQHAFCAEFGLDPFRPYKPAKLMNELRTRMQHLQADMHDLSTQLRALRDNPAELKLWLKHQRAAMREAEMFGGF